MNMSKLYLLQILLALCASSATVVSMDDANPQEKDDLKIVRELSDKRLRELRNNILPNADWHKALKRLFSQKLSKKLLNLTKADAAGKTDDIYKFEEAKIVMELEKKVKAQQPALRVKKIDSLFFLRRHRRNANEMLKLGADKLNYIDKLFYQQQKKRRRRRRDIQGAAKRVTALLKRTLPAPNSTRVTLLTTIVLQTSGKDGKKEKQSKQVLLRAPGSPVGGGALVKVNVNVKVEQLPRRTSPRLRTSSFSSSTTSSSTTTPTTTTITTSTPATTTRRTTTAVAPRATVIAQEVREPDHLSNQKEKHKLSMSEKCPIEDNGHCFFGGECVLIKFQDFEEKLCKCKPGFKGTRCEVYDILTSFDELDSADQHKLIGQGTPVQDDAPDALKSVMDATARYLANIS